MKTCIRCGEEKPKSGFWSGRATCIVCANKLWYRPKSAADPRKSPNWPMLKKAIADGLVTFPKDAFPKQSVDYVALSRKLNSMETE